MLNCKLLWLLLLGLCVGTVGYAQEPDAAQIRQMFLASRSDPQQAGVRFSNRKTPRGSGRATSGTGIVRGNTGGFGATAASKVATRKITKPANRVGEDAAVTTAEPPNAAGISPTAAVHAADVTAMRLPSGLGLGLTLFQRAANGAPVRANPQQKFTNKDKFRLWLEPGTDGYLYVFRSTDAGPPVLLFPTPTLNNGRNLVYAHIPLEWPLSDNLAAANGWFDMEADKAPTMTTFYAVLAREPLPALPTAAKLAAYCEENRNSAGQCQLAAQAWAAVNALEAVGQVYTAADNAKFVASPQQATEQPATLTTRGYGLTPDEPAPHLVFLNSDLSQTTLWVKFTISRK